MNAKAGMSAILIVCILAAGPIPASRNAIDRHLRFEIGRKQTMRLRPQPATSYRGVSGQERIEHSNPVTVEAAVIAKSVE
jgi:hypothetical protein